MLAALFLALVQIAPQAAQDSSPARPEVADPVETVQVAALPTDPRAVPGDSLAADSVAADSLLGAVTVAEPEPIEPVVVPAPQPVLFAAAETGLVVILPPGWFETPSDSKAELPAYARYSFAATTGTPLAGATLHVERLAGLNALDRERWTRGLTPYGYHGLRPVGPLDIPLPGLGIELVEPGSGGAVAFVQRGQTFWAVHVQAPEAVWAARRADVVALLGAVRLP